MTTPTKKAVDIHDLECVDINGTVSGMIKTKAKKAQAKNKAFNAGAQRFLREEKAQHTAGEFTDEMGMAERFWNNCQPMSRKEAAIYSCAPELLAALTELHNLALEGNLNNRELVAEILNQSSKAIAKAKGE